MPVTYRSRLLIPRLLLYKFIGIYILGTTYR